MNKFLVVLAILASICFSKAQAQTDALDELNLRAMHLLDTTLASINIRAQRFNQEMTTVNMLKVLDSSSLSPAKIATNRTAIKEFLGYLEVYRSISKSFRNRTDDSVDALRYAAPKFHRDGYLKEFQEAFHHDQESFEKYTVTLSLLWAKIDQVLDFLQTAKIQLNGSKIMFSDDKELSQYEQLMSDVNKLNKKVSTAGSAARKATNEASEAMNEAYGVKPK